MSLFTLAKPATTRAATTNRHGTVTGYASHGCRCASCRVAWASYKRGYGKAATHQKRVKKFLADRSDPKRELFEVNRLETREVLAAAYAGRLRNMYSHTVAVSSKGDETVLCQRVRTENLTWVGEGVAKALPSCPYCAAKLRKIPDAIRTRLFSVRS